MGLGRDARGEVAVELGDHHRDLGGIEVEPDRRPDEAAQQRVHEVDPRGLRSAPSLRSVERIPDEIDPRVRESADAEAEPDAGCEFALRPGRAPGIPQAQPTTAPRR